jgi:DNA-binding NtrC family response regulator
MARIMRRIAGLCNVNARRRGRILAEPIAGWGYNRSAVADSDETGAKRETILVVDDEVDVRVFVREALLLEGYHVLHTGDPLEARRIVESQPVHLLLTDVVMPIMNGLELAKRVEAASPTTKVLLMSGYVTAEVKGAGRPLVAKPFKPSDLLKAIRQLLDSKSAFRRPAPPAAPKPGFGPV